MFLDTGLSLNGCKIYHIISLFWVSRSSISLFYASVYQKAHSGIFRCQGSENISSWKKSKYLKKINSVSKAKNVVVHVWVPVLYFNTTYLYFLQFMALITLVAFLWLSIGAWGISLNKLVCIRSIICYIAEFTDSVLPYIAKHVYWIVVYSLTKVGKFQKGIIFEQFQQLHIVCLFHWFQLFIYIASHSLCVYGLMAIMIISSVYFTLLSHRLFSSSCWFVCFACR